MKVTGLRESGQPKVIQPPQAGPEWTVPWLLGQHLPHYTKLALWYIQMSKFETSINVLFKIYVNKVWLKLSHSLEGGLYASTLISVLWKHQRKICTSESVLTNSSSWDTTFLRWSTVAMFFREIAHIPGWELLIVTQSWVIIQLVRLNPDPVKFTQLNIALTNCFSEA